MWQYDGVRMKLVAEITTVEEDRKNRVIGRVLTSTKESDARVGQEVLLSIPSGNHDSDRWSRASAAPAVTGGRTADDRVGIIPVTCSVCGGSSWRRDPSASYIFKCATDGCTNHFGKTDGHYQNVKLLEPVTLKELDRRLAGEAVTLVADSMFDLCGCGHPRGIHDEAGQGSCEHDELGPDHCPCERFHAFCECGHAESAHLSVSGRCCEFPPELTGTDQCPCTNFRPKRST